MKQQEQKTHFVIAESIQPVRGPRCTVLGAYTSYDEAVAAATAAADKPGMKHRYHVCAQVALVATQVQVTGVTP